MLLCPAPVGCSVTLHPSELLEQPSGAGSHHGSVASPSLTSNLKEASAQGALPGSIGGQMVGYM